jgi:glycosyltransferase involved in cell wall biosynthesis
MKLLWISPNIPYPPKTGVLQRNYNLLREAARHADIYLLAVFKSGILPGHYDVEAARRELGKLCCQVDIVHLPIESSRILLYWKAFVSLFADDPFSANWAKDDGLRRRLKELVKAVPFDIVHFDTVGLAAYRDDVGQVPRILNHHNIESHLLKRRVAFERNPLRRMYYAAEGNKLESYERRVCTEFDTNFTVSALDKQRLQELVPSVKADVIANGVDVDYFRHDGGPTVSGNLIMASGMNWFPNRDAVLYMCDEIWPLVSARIPDLTLTIVGASPPQQVVDLASRDPRVVVTGFVDDVRPSLSRAAIYLCPMRDGGGTRLKILDALAMSKPIVSTTMGCEGIDVTPEVDVLIADTPDAFVRQIERLHTDAALRQSLSQAARQLAVEQYSWPVIGRNLGAIYRRLTGA